MPLKDTNCTTNSVDHDQTAPRPMCIKTLENSYVINSYQEDQHMKWYGSISHTVGMEPSAQSPVSLLMQQTCGDLLIPGRVSIG